MHGRCGHVYGDVHKTYLYTRSIRWRHEKASTERRMKSSVCRAQSRRADLSVRQVIASPPRQSTHWAEHGRTLRMSSRSADEFGYYEDCIFRDCDVCVRRIIGYETCWRPPSWRIAPLRTTRLGPLLASPNCNVLPPRCVPGYSNLD